MQSVASTPHDACPHTHVEPRRTSPGYSSFPVLSSAYEFGACRDCARLVLRELGETTWQGVGESVVNVSPAGEKPF